MTDNSIPVSELEALAERWRDEIDAYINSDIENERTMSAQQHMDACELEALIEEHKND